MPESWFLALILYIDLGRPEWVPVQHYPTLWDCQYAGRQIAEANSKPGGIDVSWRCTYHGGRPPVVRLG